MMKRKTLFLTGAASLVLAGCATMEPGTRRALANTACAGAGAAAGAAIHSDGSILERVLIGVGTAAVCATIADLWLDELEERDRERLAAITEEAAVTGDARTFSNPETGVTAKVEVVENLPQRTTTVPTKVKVLKDQVEQTPPLTIINRPYEAVKGANMRGGPGTDYKVVSSLNTGDVRNVLGRVRDTNWLFVTESGIGSGYVYEPLMRPSDRTPSATAVTGDVQTVSLEGDLPCRKVRQTVTLEGQDPIAKDVTICQQQDGKWLAV